jgi:hypothetical protein
MQRTLRLANGPDEVRPLVKFEIGVRVGERPDGRR